MIELQSIRKSYKMGDTVVRALDGISLTIDHGEFVAIMGPSGSGKSTLMHVLGLLDAPDSGSYKLLGREVSKLDEESLAKLRGETIGFIFQQFNLLARTTALDNVLLPTLYGGGKNEEDHAVAILNRVGLGKRLHHKPSELSGGQQQRVAIARSLINNPKILFADEPTGNLDSESTQEIMEILCELNRSGITVILVTHEPEIAAYANRTIRVRDGQIQSDERKTPFEKKNAQNSSRKKEDPRSPWLLAKVREIQTYTRQGITALLANKVRSGLSMLGILIGVAAVIAMLAVGNGAKKSMEEQLSSLGSNLLVLYPGARRSFGVTGETGAVARFTTEDAKDIKERVRNIKQTAPSVSGKVRLAFGAKNWSTVITGTTPDYATMRNRPTLAGRYFTNEEDAERARVVLLGTTVVQELFGDQNPIGETVKINKIGFQVIGVLKEKGAAAGFRDQDDIAVVPLNTATKRLLGKDFVDSIDIEVTDTAAMDVVQDEISNLIIRKHHLPPSQEDSFTIRNMAEIQEAISSTSRILSLLLASIAAISLLVGGIGIMNIMLVSVTERTREIGLRKAIGARKVDILAQFLVESILVSISGGILGVLLGAAITLGITQFAGWATYISPVSVLLAFVFSATIGIVFGLWPAQKASQLSPIVALRYE